MGAPVAFDMRIRELVLLGYIDSDIAVEGREDGVDREMERDYVVVQSYIDSMLPPNSHSYSNTSTNCSPNCSPNTNRVQAELLHDFNSNNNNSNNNDNNNDTTSNTNTTGNTNTNTNGIRVTYEYQKHANFWNNFYLKPRMNRTDRTDGMDRTDRTDRTCLPIGGLLSSYLTMGQIAYEPNPVTATVTPNHNTNSNTNTNSVINPVPASTAPISPVPTVKHDHVLFVHGAISTTNIGYVCMDVYMCV